MGKASHTKWMKRAWAHFSYYLKKRNQGPIQPCQYNYNPKFLKALGNIRDK